MARGIFDYLISRGKTVLLMNSAEETLTAATDDGQLRLFNDGTNQYIQTFSRATGAWERFDPAALVAPSSADYLVGTANAGLSAEIVVGTTPGGELGNTWASPTVDTVHAEGGHSAMIATHTTDGDAHHAESHTVPSHDGTPGGELGGTWTSPTVDTIHATGGGAHVTNGNTHDHSGGDGGQIHHGALSGLTDDDHGRYLKEKTWGGLASELPTHDHSSASEASNIAIGSAVTATNWRTFHSTNLGLVQELAHGASGTVLTSNGTASAPSWQAGGPTTVSKTADETVNNSTTYQNDDHLTFSVSANTIYKVTGLLLYNTGATPDIKFQWSVPASATYNIGVPQYRGSVGGNGPAWDWSGELLAGTGATPTTLWFAGIITVAGTGGSATLQWAQNTADASDTDVLDGSWITYEVVS